MSITKAYGEHWVEPGSVRVTSEFVAWTPWIGEILRPSRLHTTIECNMLNKYALRTHCRVTDVFEHPQTKALYIISKRDGMRYKAEFCKTCRKRDAKK